MDLPTLQGVVSALTVRAPAAISAQDSLFKQITEGLAAGTEGAASLIIALAAIEATVRAVILFFRHAREKPGGTVSHDAKEDIRLKLGRWLALALEFELAADILRTAVAPTWRDIGQLAAIAILRTALNYFLQKEIDKAQARQGVNPVAGGSRATDQRT